MSTMYMNDPETIGLTRIWNHLSKTRKERGSRLNKTIRYVGGELDRATSPSEVEIDVGPMVAQSRFMGELDLARDVTIKFDMTEDTLNRKIDEMKKIFSAGVPIDNYAIIADAINYSMCGKTDNCVVNKKEKDPTWDFIFNSIKTNKSKITLKTNYEILKRLFMISTLYINGFNQSPRNLPSPYSLSKIKDQETDKYLTPKDIENKILNALQEKLSDDLKKRLSGYNELINRNNTLLDEIKEKQKEVDNNRNDFRTIGQQNENLKLEKDQLVKEKDQLAKEKEQLTTKIKTLTEEKEQLTTKISTLAKEKDQLAKEKSFSEQKLGNALEILSKLVDSSYNVIPDDIKTHLAGFNKVFEASNEVSDEDNNTEYDKSYSEFSRRLNEIINTTSENATSKESNQSLSTENAELKNSNQTLSTEKAKLESRIAELEKQLSDEKEKNASDLNTAKTEFTSTENKKQSEFNKTIEMLKNDATQKYNEKMGELDSLKTENEELKKKLEETNTSNNELTIQKNDLEQRIEELNAKMAGLTTEQMGMLQEELSTVKSQYDKITEKIKQVEKEKTQLTKDIEEKDNEINELNNELTALRGPLPVLSLQAQKEEIEKKKNEINELNKKIKSVTDEKTLVETKIAELENKIKDLNAENMKLKDNNSNLANDVKQKILKNNDIINKFKNERSGYTVQINELNDKLGTLTAEKTTTLDKLKQLELELTDKSDLQSSEIENLTKTLKSLNDELALLKINYYNMEKKLNKDINVKIDQIKNVKNENTLINSQPKIYVNIAPENIQQAIDNVEKLKTIESSQSAGSKKCHKAFYKIQIAEIFESLKKNNTPPPTDVSTLADMLTN